MHMYSLQICVGKRLFLADFLTAACMWLVPSQYCMKGVRNQAPPWLSLSTLHITVQLMSWDSCWWDYDKLQGACVLQAICEEKAYSLGDQGIYPAWQSDKIHQLSSTILQKGYWHPPKLASAFNKGHPHTVTTTIRQASCLVLWPVLCFSRTGCEAKHLPHRHHNDQQKGISTSNQRASFSS